MVNVNQYTKEVLFPCLDDMGMLSDSAVLLLLATGFQESDYSNIVQFGNGPARGFYQVEPATEKDLKESLKNRHQDKYELLASYESDRKTDPMLSDLEYQVVFARLQYWRHPEPLPDANDDKGMWKYYKKYWNSDLGAAKEHEFIHAIKMARKVIE